jgi:hypothetical protein
MKFFSLRFTIVLLAAMFLTIGYVLKAQVKIGDNPATINSSAALELESTDKGLLISRMTESQKNLISTPSTGLLIYQTDAVTGFHYYNGSGWQSLNPTSLGAIYAQLSDNTIQTPSAINTATEISFSTNDEINGVTHALGNSEIEIATAGVYDMVAQPQVNRNAPSGTSEFYCWFQVNTGSGFVDIPDSNILLKMSDTDSDDVIVVSLTTFLDVGHKIRVMMSTSKTDTRLFPIAAGSGNNVGPAIPSIIFTMFKI